MDFNKQEVENHCKLLAKEISNLKGLDIILGNKNPTYPDIRTEIANASILMSILIDYLSEGTEYLIPKNPIIFQNLNVIMHKIVLSGIQNGVESELKKIILTKDYHFSSRREKIFEIVKKINDNCKSELVKNEVQKLIKYVPKHPDFGDYLDCVLSNTKGLTKEFKKKARAFFKDGISIIRNKLSHSDQMLNDDEKKRLIESDFGKAISNKGELQMTFESYSILFPQIIRFLDTINSVL